MLAILVLVIAFPQGIVGFVRDKLGIDSKNSDGRRSPSQARDKEAL